MAAMLRSQRFSGDTNTKVVFMACMQVQQHLEGPIGMALYEWQDGQIGMSCVHGGMHVVSS